MIVFRKGMCYNKIMKSLRYLYRIGRGPSSSHTIAPERASKLFLKEFPAASSYSVTLYGSLALTGKGHGTDRVISSVLPNPTIRFDTQTEVPHPNTMDFTADGKTLRIFSTGGGAILVEGRESEEKDIYPLTKFTPIKEYCQERELRLPDFVREVEGDEIFSYLSTVWEQMKSTIQQGLKAEGVLPGGLEVEKKAKLLYRQRHIDETPETKENRLVCAYAFAVGEQNASAETIVTAPTCGASGVLPAVLYYEQKKHGFSDEAIVKALAAGGLIGNVIKENSSISGAECGCQAEIGSACSMAAAALAELFEMDVDQIEYAAEVAMEHHLGLTCDPVWGLVQIPCIERNAVAAMRALNAFSLANFLTYTRKISFDTIVETMRETGRDLSQRYRETSEGGLAKLYRQPK